MATLEKIQPVATVATVEQPKNEIAVVETSAELDAGDKLIDVLQRARRAEGAARDQLSTELNAALVLLRETTDPRGAADALLELLTKKHLKGLAASDGRSCRSVAVAQLLALGFPYALEVTPEDLAHHRAQEKTISPNTKRALTALSLFAVVFPVVALLADAFTNETLSLLKTLPFAVALGLVTAAPALLLARLRPSARRATWLRRSLWFAGALGLVLGSVFTLSPATFPGGALAVIAATLLKPRPEADPDDAP